MSDVIPPLKSVESVGLIVVAGLVVYLAYRIYTTGSSIAQTISDEVKGAYEAVATPARVAADQLAINKIATARAMGGSATIPVQDQSDAETARLNALAGNGRGTDSGTDDPGFYDPMTGIKIGMVSDVVTEQQQDSPDASGLSVWSA